MYKKDMIWIAVAKLLFPATSRTRLVTREQIEREVLALFGAQLTPIQFERHLVSWEDKDKDRANPARGGDRSRYLFRTEDGVTPSRYGLYRLYKETDGQYDGVDKTGTTHPTADRVGDEYRFLADWYERTYFASS